MGILNRMRRQNAVYWPPAGNDQFGNPTYGAPVDLRVRWEDVAELYLDKTGKQAVSRSKVFTGEDVLPDGVLWKGKLIDIPVGTRRTKPLTNPKAFPITRVDNIPNLKATEFERVAYL